MAKAILITPVVPNAGGNGLAMRAGQLLDALARAYDTTLVVLPIAGPRPAQWSEFVTSRTPNPICVATEGSADRANQFAAEVRRAVADVIYDVVVIMRLYVAPILDALAASLPASPALVLDLDDDEVSTREQLAALHQRRGEAELAALELQEAGKYRILESIWLPRFNRVLVCSEEDREIVVARTAHRGVHVVPNGVRAPETSLTSRLAGSHPPRLLFVGSLGYFPNVDAAEVICREVLPGLRRLLGGDVHVDLVGTRPAAAVRALATQPGIALHADVPDVAPFYRRADMAVVPIRAGGGTRIKILEAFAHGTPVVSTSIGARGLRAVPGRHFLLADTPAAIIDACIRLLEDAALAARIAGEAQRLVSQYYDAACVVETVRRVVAEQSRDLNGPH